MKFFERISLFFSHVFLVPEEVPVFQELFIDKNPYYHEEMGEYWHLNGTFVALEYTDILKKELEAYKYYGQEHKKSVLLPKLLECFQFFCLENIDSDAIVTTVPLHFFSYLKRGYNHSELLAKGVAKANGNPFFPLLRKTRLTPHQAKLSRSARLKNVRNSFSIRPKFLMAIQGRDVIIVDDVISTGSTANECAKVLKAHGAKRVFGLFLATHITSS